jgi:hypothetical protein
MFLAKSQTVTAVLLVVVLDGLGTAAAFGGMPEKEAGGKARTPKVGDKAPGIMGLMPDGDGVPLDLKGRTVLVAFWSLDAKKKAGMPLEPLREVRKAFAADDSFLVITLCVNGWEQWDEWSDFLLSQGEVNYGDGKRRFLDDSKWWNAALLSEAKLPTTRAYGVTGAPEYFLIAPDGRLAAVDIPPKDIRKVVAEALRRKP